jgi:hypothetical protein
MLNSGTKNRPVHEVRLGAIKASIWENPAGDSIRYSVALSRIYKDKDSDQWKSTESFGRDDLLLVAKVADMAHSWIFEQRAHPEPTGDSRRPTERAPMDRAPATR